MEDQSKTALATRGNRVGREKINNHASTLSYMIHDLIHRILLVKDEVEFRWSTEEVEFETEEVEFDISTLIRSSQSITHSSS
mmetsp:Transcript_32502/g.59616  ORF Transcript_32502/g.59616 Transcript_32502/m.59616 type:complete len:82 (-) Transcript_32502:410-655(-)